MPHITIHCANPACGVLCRKYWPPAAPPPRYCSRSCVRVHDNAQRKAAGVPVWHKYSFTPEMDAAIRRAYRQRFGALTHLWETDPRFTPIPYPLVKRRVKVLGLARTVPDDTWTAEETAYALKLTEAGYAYETICKKLRAKGWQRSPSAVIAHMHRVHADRYGAFLSQHQLMQALGCDHRVLARWRRQGLLTPHHEDALGYWYAYRDVRAFVVASPGELRWAAVDTVWLVGLLSEPIAVDYRTEHDERPGPADGSWLTGEAIRDRAAAE
jgi:hypothetical protein